MNLSIKKQQSSKKPTVEHLIRKTDGGSNRKDNLAVACMTCNCNRGDYPAEMWKVICKDVIAIRREAKPARRRGGKTARKATKDMDQTARSNILHLCSAHASKFVIPAIREKYWQMERDVVDSYLQTQQPVGEH
jgi:hypothetical protein